MIKINKKGFTLIELLVVIAIIGLLSTLAVVSLNNARLKSRDAKRIADIKQVQTALEMYYTSSSTYPLATAAQLGGTNGKTISSQNGIAATASGITYMGLVPSDPTGTTICSRTAPTAACAWSYTGSTTYAISFYLEGATGALTAGAKCATADGVTDTACTY